MGTVNLGIISMFLKILDSRTNNNISLPTVNNVQVSERGRERDRESWYIAYTCRSTCTLHPQQ